MNIQLPPPDMQVSFAFKLLEARSNFLQDALKATVRSLDIQELDKELASFAPKSGLSALASRGLRGELVFPVPLLLSENPRLLGYYRLLLGYSQKLFYGTGSGMGRFKSLEERGVLTRQNKELLPTVCGYLCEMAAMLLAGIGVTTVSDDFLDDLTLLTLGP